MSEKKPKGANKGRVVAFRVTEEDFAVHAQCLADSGLKLSVYARRIWLEGTVTIVPPSENKKRLVFLYNKSSNNLNQLAHRINEIQQRGIITEKLYLNLANQLIAIRELLLNGIKDAD